MDRPERDLWKPVEVARLLALVETERRYYQEIIATLPVALATVSSGYWLLSTNRTFRQTFGMRPEEVARKRLSEVIGGGNLCDRVSDVLATGVAQYNVMFSPPAEEKRRHFRVAIIALRGWEDESDREALLVFEDVTDVQQQLSAAEGRSLPETLGEAGPGAQEARVDAKTTLKAEGPTGVTEDVRDVSTADRGVAKSNGGTSKAEGGCTVLVADPEEGIRLLMRKLLTRHGYAVLDAGTAAEAERLANEHGNIHLLISSMELPDGDSRDLLTRITARIPDTKALFAAGFPEDEVLESGVIPAGHLYLQKPFTLASFLEKVEEILEGPAQQG
jgi:CheY-like chemotaxis protein